MRISTDIAPRRDGTLILRVKGVRLLFLPEDGGRLVCDVPAELAASVLVLPRFAAVEEPAPTVVVSRSSPALDETQVAEVKTVAASKSFTPKERVAKVKG